MSVLFGIMNKLKDGNFRLCGHKYPEFSWFDPNRVPPVECPDCAYEKNELEVKEYFALLGLKMATEWFRECGKWWEFYKESGWPIFQIDVGIPLCTIIKTLKYMHLNPREKKVPDDLDFTFNGSGKEFRKLCKEVFESDL